MANTLRRVCVLSLVLSACGGDSPMDPRPGSGVAAVLFDYPADSVEVHSYILLGGTLQLSAQALDSAGNVLSAVPIEWSSSDTTVLRVSPGGELLGNGLGDAVITAAAGDRQKVLPFAVFARVASVQVLPPSVGLVPGGTIDVSFALRDSLGTQWSPRPLTLTSSDSLVATASQEYAALIVQGGGVGTAGIDVAREGKSARLEVTINQVVFDTVDAGGGRGCGLTSDGTAWCWGTNSWGALGYGGTLEGGFGSGTPGSGWTPVRVAGGHAFSHITLGNSHACALTADGTAWCWGNNATGAVGVADPGFFAQPVEVSGGLRFSQISASYAYTCGVSLSGDAYCWGYNDSGQLGDGTKSTRFTPTLVTGNVKFAQVSSRWADQFSATTCGLDLAGAAYCWGSSGSLTPAAVAGGHTFVTLSASAPRSCAIDETGDAYCWGDGENAATPTLVPGGLHWTWVSVNADHVCGVTVPGAAYCWGNNDSGQLGSGDSIPSLTQPVAVTGPSGFVTVAAAYGFTCGLAVDGVYCWGEGSSGQLGRNTTDGSLAPMRVLGQP